MRLFDKLLNRKIKGRLETDDGINAENVIKKSSNIQTVVSYDNKSEVVRVDKIVLMKQGVSVGEGKSIVFESNIASACEVLSTLLPAGEPTELFDYTETPFIALVLSANGGVAVISYDGQETGTSNIINADSNITFSVNAGTVNITAVSDTYVSTLIIARQV